MTSRFKIEFKFGKISFWALMVVLASPLVIGLLPLPQIIELPISVYKLGGARVARFLEGIKSNDGVLILGTSESGNDRDDGETYEGNSYWKILNRDSTTKHTYSIFYGAGRAAYVEIPLLLAYPEQVRGLKVLLFVNPTYWRDSLSRYSYEYFSRYNGRELMSQALDRYPEYGLEKYAELYATSVAKDPTRNLERLIQRFHGVFENFHNFFQVDLRQILHAKFAKPLPREQVVVTSPLAAQLKEGIDQVRNVSKAFHAAEPTAQLAKIDKETTFQSDSLRDFVRLAKKLGVDLTVLIGPYNGIVGRDVNPEVIPDYEEVVASIRQLLKDEGVPAIDATDISYVEAAFLDMQHHAPYGGLLLERKIAEYYRSDAKAR